jgi:hypothetical protein
VAAGRLDGVDVIPYYGFFLHIPNLYPGGV